MDGSSHRWFSDSKATLHLAINAWRNHRGSLFSEGKKHWPDTIASYKQILENYSIPAKFLTDNRTVFYYETHKTKTEERDVTTQFGYACKMLGTSIETSSVPSMKGGFEEPTRPSRTD